MKMKTLPVCLALVLLAVLFTGAPARASDAAHQVGQPTDAPATATILGASLLAPVAQADVSATADCTAYCEDGSAIPCSGPSCTAVDQNCSANERGYCSGSSGTQYCDSCSEPPPPTCEMFAPCAVHSDCGNGTCFHLQCFCG